MPIFVPEPVEERGRKDARRHRDKQKEILKEKLPEIISKEDIITGRRDRVVKIRIRSLDIPHFRPAEGDDGGVGVGQGGGEPGDIIGRRPNPGQQPSDGAGEEPGEHYVETEVDLSEVIEMMLEDLGLPNLHPKNVKEFLVSLGIEFKGLDRVGPRALLENKATAKEGIKRFWHFLRYLQQQTHLDELICYDALKKAGGILPDAEEILKDPNFKATSEKIDPFAVIYPDDLRFHRIEEEKAPESQAVVIAMMDVSGSMDDTKKYLARSMLFWIVEFLRFTYKRLEIRFLIHDSAAKIVDEHEFFHTNQSGGTISASAYKLAGELIDSEYPTDQWNVYLFHFSDGEDASPVDAILEAEKLIERGINMFAYGEVEGDATTDLNRRLLRQFQAELPNVGQVPNLANQFIVAGQAEYPFLGVRITDKSNILPAVKEFMKKERWQNDE